MSSKLPATLVDVLAARRNSTRHIHYLNGQDDRRAVQFRDMRTAALIKGIRRVTAAKLARGIYP